MADIDLDSVRAAYARLMLALAEATADRALEEAFRAIPREAFLGADPWQIFDFRRGAIPLPENDPIYACQNVLFVLQSSRGVNNGEPALHARLIHALAPARGQRVVHLGAGTGYYTAILGHLVGQNGAVIGVEYDADFADRARLNCPLSQRRLGGDRRRPVRGRAAGRDALRGALGARARAAGPVRPSGRMAAARSSTLERPATTGTARTRSWLAARCRKAATRRFWSPMTPSLFRRSHRTRWTGTSANTERVLSTATSTSHTRRPAGRTSCWRAYRKPAAGHAHGAQTLSHAQRRTCAHSRR